VYAVIKAKTVSSLGVIGRGYIVFEIKNLSSVPYLNVMPRYVDAKASDYWPGLAVEQK
jgi:hypothetical protein